LLILTAPCYADEVSDQLKKALSEYEGGNLAAAQNSLKTAGIFLSQKRADKLLEALPKPLDGWKAEKSRSSSNTMVGMTVGKKYSKGNMKVKINILTDSPMLNSMAMMFSNPMMLGGDRKLVMIGTAQAVYDERKNSYQIMVGNKALMTFDGDKKTPDEVLRSYFAGTDFAKLKSLL
jgi:hypothetical protein